MVMFVPSHQRVSEQANEADSIRMYECKKSDEAISLVIDFMTFSLQNRIFMVP